MLTYTLTSCRLVSSRLLHCIDGRATRWARRAQTRCLRLVARRCAVLHPTDPAALLLCYSTTAETSRGKSLFHYSQSTSTRPVT